MKPRIDFYNGTYVAFIWKDGIERRHDFATEELAQAWIDCEVPQEVEPKVQRGRPKKNYGEVETTVPGNSKF